MTQAWSSPATSAVADAVRRDNGLRGALAEEINALAHGETLPALIDQATVVVRSHVLGALADLRVDPTTAPPWATTLAAIPNVQDAHWQELGEALLFEVGTTGEIGAT